MNRPRLFLSAVSEEFRTARKKIANIVQNLGYDVISQDNFPTGHGELRSWLCEQIDSGEGLIQLVGIAYGAEPSKADLDYGRVSYTQFEFFYARRLEIKTRIIIIKDSCFRDKSIDKLDLPHETNHPDPAGCQAERRKLQIEYIDRLHEENHLRHYANSDAELEEQGADWRKIVEVEQWRDQQIRDLDRFLNGISEAYQEGEASKVFQMAQELLQDKGAVEALAYLEAKSEQRWKLIKDLTARRKQLNEEIRKPLREALLEASILETRFRFDEAETLYRKALMAAQGWTKPRNEFAWCLIQRGIIIEPNSGKDKLKEAVKICRETIVLKPKEKHAEDWAIIQNNLGAALQAQGTRTGGEAGAALLSQAVTACRRTGP